MLIDRAHYIVKVFGPKLDKNNKTDKSFAALLEIAVKILRADPTKKSTYAIWLARQWIKNEYRYFNDASKISNWLSVFEKLKTIKFFKNNEDPEMRKKSDISTMTVGQLADLVEQVSDKAISKAEEDRELEEQFYKKRAASKLYDSDTAKIVRLFRHDASLYFGRNTRWCTAAKDDKETFVSYAEDGELLVLLDKKNNKRWQVYFPHDGIDVDEFYNEKDEELIAGDILSTAFNEMVAKITSMKKYQNFSYPTIVYLSKIFSGETLTTANANRVLNHVFHDKGNTELIDLCLSKTKSVTDKMLWGRWQAGPKKSATNLIFKKYEDKWTPAAKKYVLDLEKDHSSNPIIKQSDLDAIFFSGSNQGVWGNDWFQPFRRV